MPKNFNNPKNINKTIKIVRKDPEKVDFALNEIVTYFEEQKHITNTIINRTVLLIGFLLAVISFAIPEISNSTIDKSHYDIALTFITIIYSAIALILVFKAFMAFNRNLAGAEPKSIIVSEYMEQDLADIKIQECIMYQKKIDEDKKMLDSIIIYFNRSIFLTTTLFLVGVFIVSYDILFQYFS